MAARGTANEERPLDLFSWSGVESSIMSLLAISGSVDAANRLYSECRFLDITYHKDVSNGYMTPKEFKNARLTLGLTQQALADRLSRKRLAIVRYEGGTRRISGLVELVLHSLGQSSHIPLVGIVAAGDPIETIPQTERTEVPKSMLGRGDTFALRVKGTSMRDDGILPGDMVVVQKQDRARNGQTVIALLNGEATIKTYHRKAGIVELHPANEAMKPMIVKEEDAFHIEGIVVGVIRHLKR